MEWVRKWWFLVVFIGGIVCTIGWFYIEDRGDRKDYIRDMAEFKKEMEELRKDLKAYSRIADDLRYELFKFRMEADGVEKDTSECTIELHNH